MEISRIIDTFLEHWEHRALIEGVLLTGSSSVGNESQNSDVDLQILLSDAGLRERGNQIVDGVMVEYFANPAANIFSYLNAEVNSYHRPTIRMFATGKIVLDKSGIMEKAHQRAKALLAVPLPKFNENEISYAKYSIWDCMDDLEMPYRTGDIGFQYVFYLNLNKVLNHYCRFLGVELTSPSKQSAQFMDSEFRKRYGIGDFPDLVFADIFLACLNADDRDAMYFNFKNLCDYTLDAMGGYSIDGWRSRIAP